jgi:hypothetical protein
MVGGIGLEPTTPTVSLQTRQVYGLDLRFLNRVMSGRFGAYRLGTSVGTNHLVLLLQIRIMGFGSACPALGIPWQGYTEVHALRTVLCI